MEESIKIEEAIAKALKLEAVDPRTYSPTSETRFTNC